MPLPAIAAAIARAGPLLARAGPTLAKIGSKAAASKGAIVKASKTIAEQAAKNPELTQTLIETAITGLSQDKNLGLSEGELRKIDPGTFMSLATDPNAEQMLEKVLLKEFIGEAKNLTPEQKAAALENMALTSAMGSKRNLMIIGCIVCCCCVVIIGAIAGGILSKNSSSESFTAQESEPNEFQTCCQNIGSLVMLAAFLLLLFYLTKTS